MVGATITEWGGSAATQSGSNRIVRLYVAAPHRAPLAPGRQQRRRRSSTSGRWVKNSIRSSGTWYPAAATSFCRERIHQVHADHVGLEGVGDLAGGGAPAAGRSSRLGDDLADRQQRARLLQPLLRLVVQPRVLQRQRELTGDGLGQIRCQSWKRAGRSL